MKSFILKENEKENIIIKQKCHAYIFHSVQGQTLEVCNSKIKKNCSYLARIL